MFSISWRAAAPEVVWVPSSSIHPRSISVADRRVPRVVVPTPCRLEQLSRHGAGGGHGDERLATVESRRHQGHDVPVAAVLAQHRGRLPQRQAGIVGPGQCEIGRRQGPAHHRQSLDRRLRQRGGASDLTGADSGAVAVGAGAEDPVQRPLHPGQPGVEDPVGWGEGPGVGKRPSHPVGVEAEERRMDHGGSHRAHGGGAPCEVAHPEALEPRRAEFLDALRGEIGQGVQGLEELPHGAGGTGGVHGAMLPPAPTARQGQHDRDGRTPCSMCGRRSRW